MRHETMRLSMVIRRVLSSYGLRFVPLACALCTVSAATLDHDTMWYLSRVTPNGDGWATASFVAKPISAEDAELVGEASAMRYGLWLFSSPAVSGEWRAPRQAVEDAPVASVSRLNDIACPGRATPARGEVCHTAIILPQIKEALGSDERKICQVVGSERWARGLERSCVPLPPARR